MIKDLLKTINNLLQRNAMSEIIALQLIKWLNIHEESIKKSIFEQVYGILMYKNLDPVRYPVNLSNHLDIVFSLRSVLKYKNDTEMIAMIIRDILESLFFIETQKVCSNCQTEGLIIIKKNQLLYECKVCGFIQNEQGVKFISQEKIEIPTIEDLKAFGVIN